MNLSQIYIWNGEIFYKLLLAVNAFSARKWYDVTTDKIIIIGIKDELYEENDFFQ
ncbi:hypothetical protein gpAD87_05695 [Paenibacillus sp. AD87]|nr:hypothetical protein gpAD87_05695 [Paenibacillus sp. AD87]